jgi:hypothetical protein
MTLAFSEPVIVFGKGRLPGKEVLLVNYQSAEGAVTE